MPKYASLTRLKISGNLAGLQVNFSDVKYKSLMRLIDVCIPNFDNDDDGPETISTTASKADAGTFRLPPTLFRREGGEYHVEEDHHSQTEEETSTISPEFFLSDDGDIQVQRLYNSVIADTDLIHARHLSCVNR